MTRPLRVLVLSGGLSHERDVSLRSGRRTAEVLRAAGCDVELRDVDAALLESLAVDRPDVVWPLLHGSTGEDGALQGVLELLGIPYVGPEPAACRMAFDKPVATSIVSSAGVTAPSGTALPHTTFRELGAQAVLTALVRRHGLPLVVKPARGGSALGVTRVAEESQLPRAMVDCYGYGDVALVEQAVSGTEVAVAVLDDGNGLRALPAVEIVPAAGTTYGYDARYTAGETRYYAPARLDPVAAAAAADAALTAHRALGLRHLSRTDLIVDTSGTPWYLETNVAPGMTELSLVPQAFAAADEDLPTAYRRLVEAAAQA